MRLRYPGTCVGCGLAIERGAEASYDRTLKTVRCLSCDADLDPQRPPEVDVGVAGASARREFERRRAGREERAKARFGNRLGGLVVALTPEPQSTRAWARGARGEAELADALADVQGIRVLNDRRVPGMRGNIDHIVVAPAGVFVVDAKLYEGLIRVRDVGRLFRRDERLFVGRRDCSKLADDMVWQVEAVERALGAAGVEPLPPILPVLCFVRGQWPLLRRPTSFRGVRLEGPRSIEGLIANTPALDPIAIDHLTAVLARALPPVVR